MTMNRLFAILSLLFFFLYHLSSATVFNAEDNYAVNCGSSGSSAANDDRKWIGDLRSRLSTFKVESKGKLISLSAADSLLASDPIPYSTAQVSRSDFTYIFKVNPGPKFIRLYFHPSSYASFKRHTSLFTAKAGSYTLLDDFSPSITADALGLKSFIKEFCINVKENQTLRITFSPSTDKSNKAYAFINGIEIVSMPENLYYSDLLPIDETIALETTHRLNIGGKSIPSGEDTGMFREWSNDSSYLMESKVSPVATTLRIRYRKVPSYTAPQKIYQTSWSIDSYVEVKKKYSFTWKLAVDTGFRYLVRLHFCELDYEMKDIGQKEFSISIDNQTVETDGDLIKWGGEIGFAFYRDYIFVVEGDITDGKRDVLISIHPHLNKELVMVDAILKGMEVLKLSNPDNNLAGMNPNVSPIHDPTTQGFQKILFVSSTGFVIAVSLIFHKLKKEKVSSKNVGSNNLCRIFSLSEIQTATESFSDKRIIRKDSFGTVYEGIIDKKTTVEVRRLMCLQKAEEFETIINILPNLKHDHLIGLIGYCRSKQEIILVYEHMAKGTFADQIFPSKENPNSPLPWEQRLSVCLSAARGFDYLHTEHNTIHRDVKSTSILLNQNFIPKISDFRLCRMKNDLTSTHISTVVKGTTGYLDPEYFFTQRLNTKSDVYSFGVVLWEALCGRPALEVGTRNTEKEQRNLAIWAHHCYKGGKIDEIIDSSIKSSISSPCLKVFTAIANKCIHNDPVKRLTMAEVATFLEKALEFQRLGSLVSKTEIDNIINLIGIDADQIVLTDQKKYDLEKTILKPEVEGPYSLDNLFMVLEIYKALTDIFSEETSMKVGKRVKETLVKFKEDTRSAKNDDTTNHDKVHSITMGVMDFMEKLSIHSVTIKSIPNLDTTAFNLEDYFKSLISILKIKLKEIAQLYRRSKMREEFFKGNRDYTVRMVKGSDSFTGVMSIQCVWSIWNQVEPHSNSFVIGQW